MSNLELVAIGLLIAPVYLLCLGCIIFQGVLAFRMVISCIKGA